MIVFFVVLAVLGVVFLGVCYLLWRKIADKSKLLLNSNNNNLLLLQQIETLNKQIVDLEKSNRLHFRMELLSTQSSNAIMLMDAEGNIDWVNDGFEKMYGYDYTSFTNKLGTNIRETSFNPLIHERLRRCLKGETVLYDALNITKSGSELWTRTALIPLLDINRQVVGMVTIDTDIHKLKMAGDRLADSTLELQKQLHNIEHQFNDLNKLVNDMFDAIEQSEAFFKETDTIIHFIKEISNKTKILGLNASIEAYSAGDSGRGFRVISNEIVNISEVTKSSATKVFDILQSVKQGSSAVQSKKMVAETAFSHHRKMLADFNVEISEIESLIDVLKVN